MHLGREPTPQTPARSPSGVSALGGVAIRKIATGGWISAALSCDDDLYVWGGRPGRAEEEGEGRIEVWGKGREERERREEEQEEEEEEEVHLVDIEGGVDVVDVAVGEGHVLAVTREGRSWALGEGRWGQLGSGRRTFEKSWIEVKGLDGKHRVVGVACGFWSSFVITQKSEE